MVNLKISDHSADLGAGRTLILKYIKQWGVKIGNELTWLRIKSGGL